MCFPLQSTFLADDDAASSPTLARRVASPPVDHDVTGSSVKPAKPTLHPVSDPAIAEDVCGVA
jgi:hypothetical protein